ncbi:Uncharacterised protein [Mycobacteroides abscessus subsp. abscessus]|nr:Uncharacterised protein [Mycobacteroides abscessus subsp. abscessus]
MTGAGRSRPASRIIDAEVRRSLPTNSSPCSSLHGSPWAAMSSVSAAIQKGSVSTRVPSMSQRTAAGFVMVPA